MTTATETRLEYLRGQIRAESISYGEIAELQDLAAHIDPGDVELLQWAGVPEYDPTPDYSDRPTIIVGTDDEGNTYGVETVGFDLPADTRIVYRNYSHGPSHDEEDGLAYEDTEA